MLIKDSVNIPRLEAGEKRDEHRQQIADTVELKGSNRVLDYETGPTNPLRQWGKPMGTLAFEKKLAAIMPPWIKFMPHAWNSNSKRSIYQVLPDGTLNHLLSYEFPMMPEHSIMERVYEDVPDMTVDNISGKDMPKMEFISPEEGWKFDTSAAPLPGYKREEKAGREKVRGWRTVLLYLSTLLEVVSVAEVERIFGADDRKEWAHKTGKQFAPTAW